ncbi:MAG: AAA family ATPase [Halobacteriaceae archaeon]
MTRTAAVVGAAGGVGATRLTVETGAALARAGHDVALLDAAWGTQGLARHVTGRVAPDLTDLLVADRPLADGLRDHDGAAGAPGRLAICAAHAPFERVASAKARDVARGLGERLDAAVDGAFDYALVDTPPVAANQAVAAVAAADRVLAVTAPTERGVDALQGTRARLADLGADLDAVVQNRVADDATPDADLTVPDAGLPPAGETPATLVTGHPVGPAAAAVAEAAVETSLDLDFEQGLVDAARRRLG